MYMNAFDAIRRNSIQDCMYNYLKKHSIYNERVNQLDNANRSIMWCNTAMAPCSLTKEQHIDP